MGRKEWFSNFTANILGVIIGIALTFGITFCVQHRQERKQTREMVTLLKREIEENRKWLESRAREWNNDFTAYWIVLDSTQWNTIPFDSLQTCVRQLRVHPISYSSSHIWSVFQNSGMVQKTHDTDLIAALSNCYFWSEEMKGVWLNYIDAKVPISEIFHWKFDGKPLGYFRAVLADPASRKALESVARYNYYNFPGYYEYASPYYDYALLLLDHYENPRKTRKVTFEQFEKMQEDNKTVK